MTHTSWINERGAEGRDNERLEYLGDAVLELVAAEYLFKRFPTYDEGQLTQIRSSLVSTVALAGLGERLRLGEALRLGRGAAKSGARRLTSLHANAFESIIGAVFLDQGYRKAGSIFLSRIGDLSSWTDPNFKGRMQALAQDRFGLPPVYRTVPDGNARSRQYVSQVSVESGPVLGEGRGGTKQTAEQGAARAAIDALVAPVSKKRRRGSRSGSASAEVAKQQPAVSAQLSPAPDLAPIGAEDQAIAAAQPIRKQRRRSRGSAAAPPSPDIKLEAAPTEIPVISPPSEVPAEIIEAAPARRRRRRSRSAGAEVTKQLPVVSAQPFPAPDLAPIVAQGQAIAAAQPSPETKLEAAPTEVPAEIIEAAPARRRRRRSRSAGAEVAKQQPAVSAQSSPAPDLAPIVAQGQAIAAAQPSPEIKLEAAPTEITEVAPARRRRRRARGGGSGAAAPVAEAPLVDAADPALAPGPPTTDNPAEPADPAKRPRTHRGRRGGRRRSGRAATPSP